MVSAAGNSQAEIKAQAAAGYFRAIALWLNQPIVDQGIYVQVQGGQSGCLQLMVEFERPPEPERLIRFLCHRIWQLNSPLIEGILVAGRPPGRRQPLWQKRIRIVTPALKASRQTANGSLAALPPRLRGSSDVKTSAGNSLLNSHLKTLRAFVLSGSAVAAFVLGCLMEVILSGGGPVLPSFSANNSRTSPPSASQPFAVNPATPQDEADLAVNEAFEATGADQIQYVSSDAAESRQEPRSAVVDAALEPVAVIPYADAQNPTDPNITLLFGGDFPLEGMPDEVLSAEELPFEGIEEYQDVDVAMMNLGTSLTDVATTLAEDYHQRTRPEAAEILRQAGVDIVNLSDTTIMEYGEDGLTDTLYTLDQTGVYRVGAGRNEYEARRPEILDVKGERIAYLSYSQGGDYAAHKDRPGVNAQDRREIAEDIRALRDEVDWIVVNYRWQTDLSEQPSHWQTNLARLAIDQGADLVVGYHPQQLQGAEVYRGRPIAYALSDFIFRVESDKSDPHGEEELQTDQDTAVLKVSLRQEQMKVELLPVQVRDARPAIASGKAAKDILQRISQASGNFENPMQSPLVLDRKSAAPQPVPSSPDTPFVQPALDTPQAAPTVSPVEPPTNTESEWLMELEMPAEEDLKDWGPKGAPEQKFQPIPEADPEMTREPAQPTTRSVQYESALPQDGSLLPSAADTASKTYEAAAASSSQEASGVVSNEAGDPAAGEVVQSEPSSNLGAISAEDQNEESKGKPQTEKTNNLSTLDGPALAPEAVPTPEGIEPYSEPLIGPLSMANDDGMADLGHVEAGKASWASENLAKEQPQQKTVTALDGDVVVQGNQVAEQESGLESQDTP